MTDDVLRRWAVQVTIRGEEDFWTGEKSVEARDAFEAIAKAPPAFASAPMEMVGITGVEIRVERKEMG